MVSLAAVWGSVGVVPDAVVGHSQGEIAAACVVGALSLEDAARVVALRSRALRALSGRGGMVSVSLSQGELAGCLVRWGERLSLAAVNGPRSMVVSGESDALSELLAWCEVEGVRARRIPVDYASHSVQVEGLRAELLDVLGPVVPRSVGVPFYSTVLGRPVDTACLDAGYWFGNLRRTVELESVTRCLVADGFGVFVEVSPHPVLSLALRETLDAVGVEGVVSGTLRRGEGGAGRFLSSAAELFVRGVGVDWLPVFGGGVRRRVELPTYAFDRGRYWLESGSGVGAVPGGDVVEAGFWEAVERGDLESLVSALGLEGADSLAGLLPSLASWRRRRRDQVVADSWRYRVSWKSLPDVKSGVVSGTWLLVVPAGCPEAVRVAEALRAQGMTLHTLEIDETDAGREILASRLREGLEGDAPAGVLSLLAGVEGAHPGCPDLPAGLAIHPDPHPGTR